MKKGKLIIIDGMDGSGKTRSMEQIVKLLKGRGHDPVVTSSWLSSELGIAARKIVTSEQGEDCAVTTLAIACAAVTHAYTHHIKPLLEQGKTVVLDRGPRSSLALQVWPYKDKHPELLSLWNAAFSRYQCDLELCFVTGLKEAKERLLARDGSLDRIEGKDENWHYLARQAYIYEKYPIDVVHNYGTLEELELTVKTAIDFYCARWETGEETAQNFHVID